METQNSRQLTGGKHRLLNFLSVLAAVAALAATVWIVVPAPSYYVWLFSVAASEWSFAPGLIALFGMVAALFFGGGKTKSAAISTGAIALLISLYPFISALTTAGKHNVSLSFGRYAAGFLARGNRIEKKTFAFAEAGGQQQLRLDVYSPPGSIQKNGASVIVVHGGSWNAGGRGDFPEWNEWLAENGYTVFDIDYRLAPQPNYLTAAGDVKCAVRWVKRHAPNFDISPDKIVLLGRSAGAHLALLAAYSANDSRIPASCCAEEAARANEDAFYLPPETAAAGELNETVRAVVSFYAPVDLIWSFDNPANELVINGKEKLRRFLGGSPHESAEIRERYLLGSPDSHINDRTPPTFLVHGGQDQLVRNENMTRLARTLETAKVSHKTISISYAQHGFDYNFDGWGAQVVQPVLLDFLRENTESDE